MRHERLKELRLERLRSLPLHHQKSAVAIALIAAGGAAFLALQTPTAGAPPAALSTRRMATEASARGLRPGLAGSEQMMGIGPQPSTPPARAATRAAVATPRPVAEMPTPRNVSSSILEQGAAKAQVQGSLATVATAGGALPGDALDISQPSISSGPLGRGVITLDAGATTAFAYIEPYQEPNTWAYRNYCGPGAAIALLSHWDRTYPARADIYQLGVDMGLDPDAGVSILGMVDPINQRIKALTGSNLDWYRYGRAESLDDFRYMIKTDVVDHGIPLITGLMTSGLPGWSYDVGHFVTIYGYVRTSDGTEYVAYADTAPPLTGHTGNGLHLWELNSFWAAVSRNCGQIW